MSSYPTHPGPFGHTWDDRERFGQRSVIEDDEPVELPLERRWPAVVIASALIIGLGAGLVWIQRSVTRASLGPTEELPMQPREFEPSLGPSPVWSNLAVSAAPAPAVTAPEPEPPATSRERPSSRAAPSAPPPPRRQALVPPPLDVETPETEARKGFDFGSPDLLRPPDEPALDPSDLRPREPAREGVPRPASDDIPDADVPDGDIPDADLPDADVPEPDPEPEPGPERDRDYSPVLGF
jgi:hypothetical protein